MDASARGSGAASSIILSSREEAVPHVVAWLAQTYGEKEGATLLKKNVYQAYVNFCGVNNFECTNAASFGKIFKRVFPRVQMARLVVDKGKKGWHYSGLTLKRAPQAATAAACSASSIDSHEEQTAGRRRRRDKRPPSPNRDYQQTFRVDDGNRLAAVSFNYSSSNIERGQSAAPSSTQQMALSLILSASSAPDVDTSFTHYPPLPPYNRPASSNVEPIFPPPHSVHSAPSDRSLSPINCGKRKRSTERNEMYGGGGGTGHHAATDLLPGEYAPGERRASYADYVPLRADIDGLQRPKSGLWPLDTSSSPVTPGPVSPVLVAGTSSSYFYSTDNGQRKHSTEARPCGVWNSNAHLYLIETLHQYCRVFRQESWPAFPINPACLKLSNVQYVVTSEDGALERSPLALCTYFALACGSMVVGNLQRSREFWVKSRELLGELFDSNDYDVACVLRHSANLSRVLDESEGRMAKGFCYLTMSKQICERIGAVNDENYELTLKMMNGYYRVPVEAEMKYAQTQPKWNKNWKEGKLCVSQYKYGRVTSVIKDYTMESFQGITAAICGDCSPHEKRRKLQVELVKLERLEEATDRVDIHYSGAGPRQLLQILRAFLHFFRAVALRHVGTEQEALASNVAFIEFLTKRLHTSSFFISWTEVSSMLLFTQEMPGLLCSLLDAQRLPLLQALFHTLEPLIKELDWLRTTYESLRVVVDHYYASRGQQPPGTLLSSPLPSPMTLPPPTLLRTSTDPASTLAYLPLSSSSLSSSCSSPSSPPLPSSASPPPPPSLAHLLAL